MDWMLVSRSDSIQERAIMFCFKKSSSFLLYLCHTILFIQLLFPFCYLPCIRGANTGITDPSRFQDWYVHDRKRALHVYNFILLFSPCFMYECDLAYNILIDKLQITSGCRLLHLVVFTEEFQREILVEYKWNAPALFFFLNNCKRTSLTARLTAPTLANIPIWISITVLQKSQFDLRVPKSALYLHWCFDSQNFNLTFRAYLVPKTTNKTS